MQAVRRFTPAFQPSVLVLLTFLLLTILAGCSTFGQQAPQTPEDNLRYGQAIVTGIYKTVGDAAQARTMSAADARNYFNKAKKGREDLDVAEGILAGIEPGGPVTASAKISTVLVVLQAIASELRTRLPAEATKAIPAVR